MPKIQHLDTALRRPKNVENAPNIDENFRFLTELARNWQFRLFTSFVKFQTSFSTLLDQLSRLTDEILLTLAGALFME